MDAPTPSSAEAVADAPDVLVLKGRGIRERRPAAEVRNHDFRQSGFLAPSELRRIRLRHEQFIRALAARLAMFLRLEFTLQLGKVQVVGYQKFTESLPGSTHITLFKTDPLKGVGLLVIPPRLGLALVDRLLGGPGQSSEASRDLTEIEITLLDQVAILTLAEWCAQWPERRDLQPSLLGHENNSRFLQTATPDTAMLLFTIMGGMADMSEPLQLAIPYATVEPLVRLLSPSLPEPTALPAPAPALEWNPEFNDMQVPLIAEWHGLKMSAGDITRLNPGDVVMLDAACVAQVHLRFGQMPKFVGQAGTAGGKWAVQITHASNP